MESKQDKVLILFFNQPSKQWHFDEITKQTNMARSKVDRWLKHLIEDKVIVKIKEKGRMPYYLANIKSPRYQNMKRMFAFKLLNDSGMLDFLLKNMQLKTVIFSAALSDGTGMKKAI